MQDTITILGINGRIGQDAARAFVAAGWRVTGFGREDRVHIPGVSFVTGDADTPTDVARAVAPSEVVLDAVNLPYDKWDKGRFERSLAARLEGLKGSGKTLLYPGNIYNFAAETHVLGPETPEHPARDKGEIRVRLERMLKEATADGSVQAIVLRAPDFFGPGATGTAFDLFMLKNIEKGQLLYPGDPAIGHSWAYLPDLARAFVRVAEARGTLAPFDRLHFSGLFATGHELRATMERALGHRVVLKRVNWLPYRALALAVPILREVIKMNYLWENPHRLVDPRLDALLGPNFLTPFEEAMTRTVRSYLPAHAASAYEVDAAA